MQVRALREDELAEHAELIYLSYSHGRDLEPGSMLTHRDWWLQSVERNSYYEPEQTRVMELDGRLVSTVTCFHRPTHLAGRQVKAACIGSVATHPDYRKRGLAREVLQEAVEWMTAEGYQWSFLYGKYEVYGGSGWENLSSWDTIADLRPREQYLGEVSLRPADPEADAALLAQMHSQFNSNLTGPTVRTEQFWRRRVLSETPWGSAATYEIAEQGGAAVGYLCMEGARVQEIAWTERPHELVAQALGRAQGQPVHFGFWLPELTEALRDVSAMPTQKQCYDEPGGVHLRESYRGLWRHHAPSPEAGLPTDTESLVRLMRESNYVMWPPDRA